MSEPEKLGTNPGGEKQVELQLGGRHLVLGIALLALAGAALFFLGRLSERLARPAAPPAEGITQTALTERKSAPDPAAPHELTFYETLGKKDTAGFHSSPKGGDRKEQPPDLPPLARSHPPAGSTAPESTPVRGTTRPPVAPRSAPAGATFRIQVAATRDARAAKVLADRLRRKGYAAAVETGRFGDGSPQYRVRVGNYRNRDLAKRAAARIRTSERIEAWIIREGG